MGFVCQPECKDLDRGQVGGLRLCPVQQTGKDQVNSHEVSDTLPPR